MLEQEHHTSQEELLPYSPSSANSHSGASSIASSFDELAKGLATGTLSRGKALPVDGWRPPGSRVGLRTRGGLGR